MFVIQTWTCLGSQRLSESVRAERNQTSGAVDRWSVWVCVFDGKQTLLQGEHVYLIHVQHANTYGKNRNQIMHNKKHYPATPLMITTTSQARYQSIVNMLHDRKGGGGAHIKN